MSVVRDLAVTVVPVQNRDKAVGTMDNNVAALLSLQIFEYWG